MRLAGRVVLGLGRSMVAVLLVLALVSIGTQEPNPPSSGGYYEITYCMENTNENPPTQCSGRWYTTGGSYSTDGPYYNYAGGLHGGGAPTGGDPIWAGPGSAWTQGSVVAKFKWNDGGDEANTPPQAVIIREESFAGWSADWDGDCSNGLGHEPVDTSSGDMLGEFSHGVVYRVVKPSDPMEFTVSCSPTAEATHVGVGSQLAGGVEVRYKVEVAHEIRLELTGVTRYNDSDRILIGQHLQADLVFKPGLEGVQSEEYEWLLSGGAPFKDFDPTKNAEQYTEWASEDAPSMEVYFARPEQVTVAVAMDIAIYYAEDDYLLHLDDSLDEELIVEAPDWSFSVPAIGEPMLLDATWNENLTSPTMIALWGAEYESDTSGIWFRGRAKTPEYYVDSGSSVPDNGIWCWAQLVTKGIYTIETPFGRTCWEGNFSAGTPRLDSQYPYKNRENDPDDEWQNEDDAPADGFPSFVESVTVNHGYKTYMMYRPPGSLAKFVPLRYVE